MIRHVWVGFINIKMDKRKKYKELYVFMEKVTVHGTAELVL